MVTKLEVPVIKPMSIPDEVRPLLAARAATDPQADGLLKLTKPDERVGEPSLELQTFCQMLLQRRYEA